VNYHHDSSEKGSLTTLIDKGYLHGFIGGGCGLIFTPLLQARGYLPSNLFVTAAGILVCAFIGRGTWRLSVKSAERFGNSIYVPSGNTTAYTPTYSHIEALEIKGDLDGAAFAWEAAIAEHPGHIITVVRAADFHLRTRKDPKAAFELYLKARAFNTGTDDIRRYVQQKIVDLYLGPLNDESRALTELRRLIDGFPGTPEAESARTALSELKARRSTS
jgi:hypothetical protein